MSVFGRLSITFLSFSTPVHNNYSYSDKMTVNGVVSFDSLFLNDGDIGSLNFNSQKGEKGGVGRYNGGSWKKPRFELWSTTRS